MQDNTIHKIGFVVKKHGENRLDFINCFEEDCFEEGSFEFI